MEHKTESKSAGSKPAKNMRKKTAKSAAPKLFKGRRIHTAEDLKNPDFMKPYSSEDEWVAEIHAALDKKKK